MHNLAGDPPPRVSRTIIAVLSTAALGLSVGCNEPPPPTTSSSATASAPTATATATAAATAKPKAAPDEVVALVLGGDHSFMLYGDGTVRAWGNNDDGALGFAKKKQRVVKPTRVSSLKYVQQISTTDGHSCAVHADGLARCWGRNTGGALGDGTSQSHAFPTPVTDLREVVGIAVGGNHSCARLGKGSIHCWGRVISGSRTKPVELEGAGKMESMALGGNHSCGLMGDGAVSCWDLVLGLKYDAKDAKDDGDGNIKATPQPVKGLEDVKQLSVSGTHACAVLGAGTVSCWGRGTRGALGDGESGHGHGSVEPKAVAGLKDVKHVAAGEAFTCALLKSGAVQCWGDNAWGQLGMGDKKRRTKPEKAVPELGDVRLLGAGRGHVCALKKDKSLLCWGKNMDGQVGDGTAGLLAARTKPTPAKLAD